MDRVAAEEAYRPSAEEALRAFPIEPGEVRLVSISENVTFRVDDRGRLGAYVLRLHRPGYHTLEELNSERTWIHALGAAGLSVPTPVPARDGREYVPVSVPATGETRYAGVTLWTEGEVLAERLRHLDDAVRVAGYYGRLGSIVAAMHNQASAWRVPPTFRRHALDREGLMGEAPFWGRFWTHPMLSADERRLLLDTRERIRSVMDRYGCDPGTYSMIHADLHPANVLVAGDRLVVIDFDDAGFGWHQYDVAVALFGHWTAVDYPDIERAFFEGYLAVRDMPEEARRLVPMFLLVRGMALIGWCHQRPEIDRSGFLRFLKDAVCTRCATFEEPC